MSVFFLAYEYQDKMIQFPFFCCQGGNGSQIAYSAGPVISWDTKKD